jgi:trigger factor
MTEEESKNITVTPQTGSTVSIEGEVPFAYLEAHRTAAVKHLAKHIKLDGFREGHVPEKMLIERVGEMALLTEMAERALRDVYPAVVKGHELDVIGYPEITITKIAKNNPLGFKAKVAVVPPVMLPDYKAIAKEKNLGRESDEVTDTEVEEQIKDILRQKVAYERLQAKATIGGSPDAPSEASGEEGAKKAETEVAKKDMGGVTELPTPETVAEKDDEEKELPLPVLTDALVKELGKPGQFENVADFKAKMKEHLGIQKKQDVAAKHRAIITDGIIEQTTVELPQVMIDAEINQMLAQMTEDLTRANLTMDGYLSHIKKTKDELKAEWTPAAEKRAKLQLVLNEIAEKEDIHADAEKVNHEVAHLLEHYKDADKERVRIYVESVLRNEAVMSMLEAS